MSLLFLTPPPLDQFRQRLALLAVADGWLLLDIGCFVVFFYK